jgi:hypothetical protein
MAVSLVVVGIVAWSLVAPPLGLSPLEPVALGLATLGSLLPDFDHPSSWVGRRVPVISRPVVAIPGHRGRHPFRPCGARVPDLSALAGSAVIPAKPRATDGIRQAARDSGRDLTGVE